MANIIGTELDDNLTGTAADDTISGLGGRDHLNGGAGNDTLYGGAGDDAMHGDAGADIMYGGAGNDDYYVDDVNDVVSETTVPGVDDGGNDRVYSTVSYTLSPFLERLVLLESAVAISATGNAQVNTIVGNSNDNIISGGGGKDTLTGGLGADTFVFGPANAANTVTITDFAAEDKFGITASDYRLSQGNGLVDNGSGTLVLDPTWFATVTGTQGTVAGHGQFLYNTTTRSVMWDPDGSGAAAGIPLATLQAGAVVTANNFTISGATSTPVVGNISITDVTITEGDSGTKTATFTVSHTGTAAFSVDYATANGTATAGSDYVAASNTLNFAAGSGAAQSQTVSVTINGDTTVEPNETFFVNLLNPTAGGTIVKSQGIGTISNDDAVGNISIGDVAIAEGNAGTSIATFTVTRTGGAAAFDLTYATADGTATAGSDYVGQPTGTVSFAAGDLTKAISVTINGDTTVEPDETFFVNLLGATNGGTIVKSQGTGTITNDDTVGSISIGDVAIAEGNAGTSIATFTVTRTGGTAAFDVNYATADGTATAGSDYVAQPTGTVSFAAGDLTKTISVTINGDTTVEPDETFFVNLLGATNGGTIVKSQGTGTITNDDTVGNISISDVTIAEGNAGTSTATFTVTRTSGTAAFDINYATADGTATAGSDYVAQPTGTVSFAAGDLTKTISVTINGDTTVEPDETFFVNLLGATNGGTIVKSQGTGTIANDDSGGGVKVPQFHQMFGTDAGEDLNGTAGRDQLYGFGGNDRLYANGGDDQLYGGTGNDLLDGGTGADVMYGGSGDDLYRVDNLADIVSEQTVAGVDDGGIDTVESTITYALPMFIEKLTLKGTAAINGTGNDLANRLAGNDAANVLSGRAGGDVIYGNGGDDILIGGAGKDELWGGTGSDTFVFNFPDPTSTDTVKDFSAADHDHIGIYASDYGLSLGQGLVDDGTGKLILDPAYFAAVAGSASTVQGTSSGHGQFVFSSTASTHTLMWDADGAGPSHGVALATFNLDATPSAADFFVFSTPPTVTVSAGPGPIPQRADAQVGFTIDLSGPTNEDVLLTYSTIDGTAVAGSNFVGVSHGQMVIPTGSTSATVLINVLNHDVPAVESFNLHVDSAVGATTGTALSIAGSTASGSIAPLPPEVVAITDTAAFGSQDPFGLAYVPGLDTLFMVDPNGLSHVNNLFALNLDGTLKPDGVSSLGLGLQPAYLAFGYKPAGLAFDPSSGRLYIADDDQLKIEWVDPANPTKELGEFSAQALGSTDTEDVMVNPNNGHVFIVNGGDFGAPKIIETDATGSQIFSTIDLTTAVQGQIKGSPEGIAYDAAHDVFFVGGNNFDIKVVNRSGAVLDDITLLSNYRNPTGNIGVDIQGLTLAPSSDPNDDPAKLNLYVADAGLLNGHNDGRLIEIDLHAGLLYA